MRVFLVAQERTAETGQFAALRPLIDRPFVQRVIEALVEFDHAELTLMGDGETTSLTLALGKGSRWGCQLRYETAEDSLTQALRELAQALPPTELVLVGNAACLPAGSIVRPGEGSLARPPQGSGQGWACVSARRLQALSDALELWPQLVAGFAEGPCPATSVVAEQDWLAAQASLLTERQQDRKARVHPKATILGGVYLGPGVRVAEGATVGPNVSVGANSVIEAGTEVHNSIILPDSFIGQNLEVDNAIVAGNRLTDLNVGATITIPDKFLLDQLR